MRKAKKQIQKASVAWDIIVKVGLMALQWLKGNVAYGQMVNFRTQDSDGTWIAGNIFDDGDTVLIINVGGALLSSIGIGQQIKDAVEDDGV